MEADWICRQCKAPLTMRKVVFEYLGHSISHELPGCPRCGSILITGELARGKITEVETMLEDK